TVQHLAGPSNSPTIDLVGFLSQAEDGRRARNVTGVQTCALPICKRSLFRREKDNPGNRRSALSGIKTERLFRVLQKFLYSRRLCHSKTSGNPCLPEPLPG